VLLDPRGADDASAVVLCLSIVKLGVGAAELDELVVWRGPYVLRLRCCTGVSLPQAAAPEESSHCPGVVLQANIDRLSPEERGASSAPGDVEPHPPTPQETRSP
jgi:hypothetical protein